MVSTELLAQEAEREGVVASDAELREVIHKNPDFQRDEKFDPQRYDTVLHDYYQKTKTQYESQLRRRMAAAKLLELVASGASVSEDEVKAKFFRDADKATLTFVRFTPTQFADKVAGPKEGELKSYAQAHAKEISDYYESNSFLYQKPEEVRARHILIKLDKDAPPQKKGGGEKEAGGDSEGNRSRKGLCSGSERILGGPRQQGGGRRSWFQPAHRMGSCVRGDSLLAQAG